MLSDADIASMSKEERMALSRRLAAFNADLVRDTDATRRRRRRIIDILVISAITAVFGELPLAALLFAGALRLLRLTTHTARSLAGDVDDLLLWRVPLFGIDPVD